MGSGVRPTARDRDLPGNKVFAQNHSSNKLFGILHCILTVGEVKERGSGPEQGLARGGPILYLGSRLSMELIVPGWVSISALPACVLPQIFGGEGHPLGMLQSPHPKSPGELPIQPLAPSPS